jgi:hypothetical protein
MGRALGIFYSGFNEKSRQLFASGSELKHFKRGATGTLYRGG